jgi:hypothetical protein
MKLIGFHFADFAQIQEAVTDELKNVHKEEFSAAFQKPYNRSKACIYANGVYFELKNYVFLMRFRVLKSALKHLGRIV